MDLLISLYEREKERICECFEKEPAKEFNYSRIRTLLFAVSDETRDGVLRDYYQSCVEACMERIQVWFEQVRKLKAD